MSKYLLDKFLFTVDRDRELTERYRQDPAGTVAWWEAEEANRILHAVDLAMTAPLGDPKGPDYRLHWDSQTGHGTTRLWPLPWPGRRDRARGGRGPHPVGGDGRRQGGRAVSQEGRSRRLQGLAREGFGNPLHQLEVERDVPAAVRPVLPEPGPERRQVDLS